ncbi:hypothetical protein RHGRI_006898 [Rhododendron griersonianum]|uniref:Uncharacterized protein n=1 Tax=Rhododendron griersonianum TaxID=479676 RepID=A0AAV6KUV7_9ERIC|nr:hypothetical protein RHGRI_006898 [Rhododendron griersonianum]
MPKPTSSTSALYHHLWYSSATCRRYRTTSSPLQPSASSTLQLLRHMPPPLFLRIKTPLLLLRYDTAARSSPLLLCFQTATHWFPSPLQSASPLQAAASPPHQHRCCSSSISPLLILRFHRLSLCLFRRQTWRPRPYRR